MRVGWRCRRRPLHGIVWTGRWMWGMRLPADVRKSIPESCVCYFGWSNHETCPGGVRSPETPTLFPIFRCGDAAREFFDRSTFSYSIWITSPTTGSYKLCNLILRDGRNWFTNKGTCSKCKGMSRGWKIYYGKPSTIPFEFILGGTQFESEVVEVGRKETSVLRLEQWWQLN